jgi:hypothetical protein
MSKTILLLRHAEEPDAPKSLDLSSAGRERAEKLSRFLPKKFGVPAFIHAAAPNGSSVRAYLTVRPLADATRVQIDGSYKSSEFGALASRLLSDPAYAKKTTLVCWTHSDLPALAGALHVREDEFPVIWDETVFDWIFRLTYRGKGRPRVKKVVQPF